MAETAALEMNDRRDSALISANDPLLAPMIRARGREERDAALEAILIRHVRPVIDRVLARYRRSDRIVGGEEAEDIAAAVVLRLVVRLQAAARDEQEVIASVEDFAATLTFNAVYDCMRRRFPQRTRLKNRLRHAVTRDPRFRTWCGPAGVVCALAGWPQSNDFASWRELQPPRGRLAADRLGDAVEHLLAAAARPVLLDDLRDLLATHWNIVDDPPAEVSASAADPAAPHPAQLEARQYLAALWKEILKLRRPHRAALLLNLRDADGGNAIALLVLVGIASIDAIAAALELPVETLASLWNDLPLDDRRIAEMLDMTRQQVINARRTARERLARRMKGPS